MTRVLEELRKLGRPLTPSGGERCVPVRIRGIGTGTGSEQAPHHRQVAAQRRDEKRGSSLSVGLLSADSAAQQLIDALEIPRFGRRDQR